MRDSSLPSTHLETNLGPRHAQCILVKFYLILQVECIAWWAFLFDSFLFVLYLYENRHIILIIPEDFCQGRPFLVHKIVHFNENSATYK